MASVGRHDEVVALEHGLQADKDSGPQNVVERMVDRRNCLGVDQHLPELGSQLLGMLAEQIDALLLPVTSDCAIVDRDEAHPEPRQGVVIGPEVQFHLVDFDAAAREAPRLPDLTTPATRSSTGKSPSCGLKATRNVVARLLSPRK